MNNNKYNDNASIIACILAGLFLHSLPRQPQWGVWLADEDAGRATAAGKYTRTADYRLHSQSRAIDQDEKAPNPQRAKEGGLTTLLRAIYPFFTSTWGGRRCSKCFDVLATSSRY